MSKPKKSAAPCTVTNQELLDLMGQLKLGKNEIERTVKAIADELTYEKAQELMLEVAKNCSDFNGQNNYDKFVWLTRAAYVSGFAQAMEIYSVSIGQSIAEAINKNREATQQTT